MNEVIRAGGFAQWQPQSAAPDDHERQLLAWLRGVLTVPSERPPIYMAYGAQDRFASSIEVLAAALPADRVVLQPGEHDWATWITLWGALLDRDPFGTLSLC